MVKDIYIEENHYFIILEVPIRGTVVSFKVDSGDKDFRLSLTEHRKEITGVDEYIVKSINEIKSSLELFEMRESLIGGVVKMGILTRIEETDKKECNDVCRRRKIISNTYVDNNTKIEGLEGMISLLDRVMGRKNYRVGPPLTLDLGLKV